jgi:hypothetical protein
MFKLEQASALLCKPGSILAAEISYPPDEVLEIDEKPARSTERVGVDAMLSFIRNKRLHH